MNKERLALLLLKGLSFLLKEKQPASQVVLQSYERIQAMFMGKACKGKINKTEKEATGEREIFNKKTNIEGFYFSHPMRLSFL